MSNKPTQQEIEQLEGGLEVIESIARWYEQGAERLKKQGDERLEKLKADAKRYEADAPANAINAKLADGTPVISYGLALAEVKSRGPEMIDGMPNRDIIPAPYASAEQYVQAMFNLIEDYNNRIKKAEEATEASKAKLVKLKKDLEKAQIEAEIERAGRTAIERHNIAIAKLDRSIGDFLKKNQEAMFAIDGSFLPLYDGKKLRRVSSRLKEMAQRIDDLFEQQSEYVDFVEVDK